MAYRIRELRVAREMTQEDLAKLSGISRTTICMLETGEDKNTTSKTLLKIANALKVPVDAIFSANDA